MSGGLQQGKGHNLASWVEQGFLERRAAIEAQRTASQYRFGLLTDCHFYVCATFSQLFGHMILSESQFTADQALGGKGHGLRRLRAAGVPVPDFVVVTANTFDAVLAGLNVDAQGLVLREKALRQFVLSAADEQALRALLARWDFPHQPVVVRSSVADEDGAHAAFAGLMDSFLNLTSLPQVLDAVARCAASAYSDRALAYRQLKQLPPARPAVIVQQQVMPLVSGVMFTTLPEYPQELAVHAVWGFGEGLVGGALEPDEFYLIKKTGQPSRHKIAHKPQQYLARPADSQPGLQVVAVPAESQDVACLTPAQLAELFEVGSRLEQALGGPQDVEFVVGASGLWMVQVRPITQPIPEVVVYDNSNIQESYCGVTTPLTFSFAQRAYATVYRQTMRVLGLPAQQIEEHEAVLTQLLGLVKGRIYYNINNWYRGLQLLPSFRQNKADMERMMGLEEPVDFVTDQQKTLGIKLRMLPRLALNMVRLLRAFGQLKNQVLGFQAHFLTHYQRFYTLPLATLSRQELLHEKTWLDTHLLGNWTTPIINDFYVMMANGQVARRLKRAGIADTDEFLSCYLAGDALIASTEPTYHMQALARQAWPQPELRALIVDAAPDVHQQVQHLVPDFHRAVEAFLGKYGDRTAGELKLETLTMRVSPLVFYQYLRNFLLSEPAPATKPTVLLHEQARQQLTDLLARRPVWARQRTWASLQKLQRAIRYREALRLERTRLFGMYRALYLAMGEKLTDGQQLHVPRDVFWLTEQEIAETLVLDDRPRLHSLVEERQQGFARYAGEDVPSRVIVPSPPATVTPPASTRPDTLMGTGCYPGQAEGEVLVITDPGGELNVTGKIVCALRTDPGWAALFPMCRGVIIEKGSSLSHSVILLRELGIPTIINVPGVTKHLQTGQRIRINGQTGEIRAGQQLSKSDDHP